MPSASTSTIVGSIDTTDPIWASAPLLKGQTHFHPQTDIKNIMITGGAGFIASWVVRHLALTYTNDYRIISFDKLDYCASLNNTAQLNDKPNFGFYQGDITNPVEVMDCLQKYEIDTVMHFAAQSHVDLSFGNSYDFTATNVYGTHVLLECVRNYNKLKKFIHVSTDEVYGEVKDEDDDLLEESLLAPTNPYAASKAAAEMIVHAYMKSFNVPVIIVRSNNVYGPHQYPEKVIPKFILMLQRGRKLTLHGKGTHTRRYLYGGDAADAFDTILHKGLLGHVYNVGSYDEISNLQLCSMLLKHFDIGGDGKSVHDYITHVQDRPFNDHRYAVDGSRLRSLGWTQKTSFEEGLRTTVNWYCERNRGSRWWGSIESRLQAYPEPPSPPPSPSLEYSIL